MEFFDVLNDKGERTGEVKAREWVHRDGDWHRTVHCWLLNEKGELLVQFRGALQESNPQQWDISCAGHVSAGEDMWLGAERELKEELGLVMSRQRLRHLGTCRSECFESGIKDREISEIFLIDWHDNEQPFRLCEREVEAIQWIDWRELKKKIEAADVEFVEHPSEYECLFEHLQKRDDQSLD